MVLVAKGIGVELTALGPLQGCPSPKGSPTRKERLLRTLCDHFNLRASFCLEEAHIVTGVERRLQTGGDKASADGAPEGRSYLASAYKESGSPKAPATPQESGLPWIYKPRKRSFARVRVQAEDFCVGHSISLGRLAEFFSGTLNTRLSMSAFAYCRRMYACLDTTGMSLSLRNSWGNSNVSTLACESSEICALRIVETIANDERDVANIVTPQPSSALRRVPLPLDELANLLFAAVADPTLVDIGQIRSQMGIRFRRTPSETYISDLQQKLATLKLPSCTTKTLLKKKSFLFSSPDTCKPLSRFLQDFFESGEKACNIVVRNPSIIEKTVEHVQKMLNLISEFRIEKQTVEKRGDLFIFDVDRTRDVLTFLKNWGVHAAGRNRMLSRNFGFLRRRDKLCTQSVLTFLESIGMSKSEILALLLDNPDLLRRSVAKSLMPKHGLCQKLGWNFSLVLPFIKYHGYERILSQITFLKEQGLSEETIVKLVEKEPRILGKSKRNLQLKLDFLLHTHNRSVSEVLSFPACLGYSFECRILPRFRFLKTKAKLDSSSLSYILSLKSSTFRSVFNVPDSVNPI
ncbi:hypothetical protein L7F22_020836 [Adiantum nelumboides]|nr:hypothetical protein [Adiantum nelumboides]